MPHKTPYKSEATDLATTVRDVKVASDFGSNPVSTQGDLTHRSSEKAW